MTYVLTVDDENDVLGSLWRVLSREGYEIGQALSGQDAWYKINQRRPDVLLLDINMPNMDGLTLCRQLRGDPRFIKLPILFLTARLATEDIIAGLDAGGDDYVSKPFQIPELLARVRALLRRTTRDENSAPIIEMGGLSLNSDTYQVATNGRNVQLTATEHRLLRYLMEHPNQALSPQRLLEAVWDYPPQTGDPDLVRAHVRNLRAKLEANMETPSTIRTIRGVGYMVSV
jgi:two-component system, OmpR family, response regulator RpaA